jgi:mannose-6-phosphate isomerase class I
MRTSTDRPRPPVNCPYFSLEILQVEPGERIKIAPEPGPQVFTCVRGETELGAGQGAVALDAGATAVLFAKVGPARIESSTGGRVLRAWVGD